MKWFWVNDGNPVEAEGNNVVAMVDLENGKPPQKFLAADHKAMSDKLLEAQMHASNRIEQLKGTRTLEAAPPVTQGPKPLTADDRFLLAQQLQDPAKAAEAIERIVEAKLGLPLSKLVERIESSTEDQTKEQILRECNAFRAETPEYHHNAHNAKLLVNWLDAQGYPITKNNLGVAFDHLSTTGLMVAKPEAAPQPGAEQEEQPPTPQANQPSVITRERRVIASTGIRSGDSGPSPAPSVTPPNKLTREQIERMPETEYRRRFTGEPGFAEAVDKLYETQPQRTASR